MAWDVYNIHTIKKISVHITVVLTVLTTAEMLVDAAASTFLSTGGSEQKVPSVVEPCHNIFLIIYTSLYSFSNLSLHGSNCLFRLGRPLLQISLNA